MTSLNESTVELAALEYLRQLGYATAFGPDLASDGATPEPASYEQVYLEERLGAATTRINPAATPAMVEDALMRLFRPESQNAMAENFRAHKLLTDGVPVEHRGSDGAIRPHRIWLIDFAACEFRDRRLTMTPSAALNEACDIPVGPAGGQACER